MKKKSTTESTNRAIMGCREHLVEQEFGIGWVQHGRREDESESHEHESRERRL